MEYWSHYDQWTKATMISLQNMVLNQKSPMANGAEHRFHKAWKLPGRGGLGLARSCLWCWQHPTPPWERTSHCTGEGRRLGCVSVWECVYECESAGEREVMWAFECVWSLVWDNVWARERLRVCEYQCKQGIWMSSCVWGRVCLHEYADLGEYECKQCVLMDVSVRKSKQCDNGLSVWVLNE